MYGKNESVPVCVCVHSQSVKCWFFLMTKMTMMDMIIYIKNKNQVWTLNTHKK